MITGNDDLQSFRDGHEQGFDQVFRKYYSSLRWFAESLIKNSIAAEDIVQECFCKLWEQKERLKKIELVKSYLFTVVKNKSLTWLKKKAYIDRQNQQYEKLLEHFEKNVVAKLIEAEVVSQMHASLKTLPAKMQEVCRMTFIDGEKLSEVARKLKKSETTIRKQKNRGVILLRIRLHEL